MLARTRLIAALDFGTHGTGFAWAFASERDRDPHNRRIFVFEDWTGQPTQYIKNLSALVLDSSGEVIDWGYQARNRYRTESKQRPDLDYHERFKMGLLDGSGITTISKSRNLITQYLRVFYQLAIDQITSKSQVENNEIAWFLTVPAIWRDQERRMMRECAVSAGFPSEESRLHIAVEPEVAALYCRYDSGIAGASELGKRFMVVDAGGGTVDITAYEVASDGLTEIGYTSGGSHGATYVDEQLINTVLVDRLGDQTVARIENLEPGALIALMDEWERKKRTFDPDEGVSTMLPFSYRMARILGDDAHHRLSKRQHGIDDEIVLTPAEVTRLFDHSVTPILSLVDDQIRRIGKPTIDTILLVGGFAQSKYLQKALRKHIANRAKVIVPGHPSWAVLLGAVHYGLQPEVIMGRRSRLTYGVSASMVFEDSDPVSYKFVDDDEIIRCKDRFDIFVHTNDIVEQGREVRRTYFPLWKNQRDLTIDIHTSTDHEPRYTTDDSCAQLGKLVLDISETVGKPTKDREVEVIMVFGGTEIAARAIDKNTLKEVTAKVSFDRKV